MFRDLFNFQGINWWVLLGGLGLNFVTTIFFSLGGAYLTSNEATVGFYQSYGAPLMVVAMFLACGLTGWMIGKISDDLPVKHAFLSSLGAVAPLVFVGVLSFNLTMVMLALVAVAGNFNGGMLSVPKRHYGPPPSK